MVQIIDMPGSPGPSLGSQLGSLLGQARQQQMQQQQSALLSKILHGEATPEESAQLSPELQLQAAKLGQASQAQAMKDLQKAQETMEKQKQEQKEAEILAKYQAGESLNNQELASLSPTSLRTLIGQQKPTFEPTEEKLEAERVSKLASEIEGEYRGSKSEDQRLDRMESLSEKGNLTTPLLKNMMDRVGLPLGVLGNPDSEEFSKLEADFLRDVRNIFPGGRITNYEIQAYLKGIPSLSNTSDGRKAIIRNRRILNEAKQARYSAYREILNENNGKKPRNLDLLIEDKVGPKLDELEVKFREGLGGEEVSSFVLMKDNQGRLVRIPSNRVDDALKSGAQWVK